jgi:type II secretory pathway component PulF
MARIVSHVTLSGADAPMPRVRKPGPLARLGAAVLARARAPRRSTLTKTQAVAFLDELAELLEAGIGLTAAVRIVGDASSHARVKAVCHGLTRRLTHGATLSDAMEQEGFSPLVAASVRAGEASGNFAQIFRTILEALRREMATRADVARAMAYPAFILVLLGAVLVLFLTYVLPRIEPLLGTERPLATQILLGLGRLATSGWLLVIAAGVVVVVFRRVYRSPRRFSMPVLGPFFQRLALERLFGYLSLLLRSGVHLIRAFEVAADALADPVVASRCRSIMLRLQHGMPLADAMRLEPLIPSIAIQLITVGEEAALLDRQFDKLHRLMKSNIERHLRLLVGMVGPVMLALSAGFILLLFFGMFLPMYQNISALSLPR